MPPERLIKALLLQALYSVRSEIQLCEQIGYNLLFRWFLDMRPSEKVWTPEVFSMNRDRFERHGFVRTFFERVVSEAMLEGLASREEFCVDGTLIQSHASLKSLRPIESKDAKVSDSSDDDDPGNPSVNFRGQKRSNATHRVLVDPQARLMRKGPGQPALLSHSANVLMETRNGLVVDIAVDEANGTAERTQALAMLDAVRKRRARCWPRVLGGDGGYQAGSFLHALERRGVAAYVPLRETIRGDGPEAEARRSAYRRTKSAAYRVVQRTRKRVESRRVRLAAPAAAGVRGTPPPIRGWRSPLVVHLRSNQRRSMELRCGKRQAAPYVTFVSNQCGSPAFHWRDRRRLSPAPDLTNA